MVGKRRPLAILWHQLHISGGFHFQVHRVVVRRVTKRLGKTRVNVKDIIKLAAVYSSIMIAFSLVYYSFTDYAIKVRDVGLISVMAIASYISITLRVRLRYLASST